MCLALHILKDAWGAPAASEVSATNRLDTGWSVTTASPWHRPKRVAITRQTQAAKQTVRPLFQEHQQPKRAKAVMITAPVRSILYLHIHTHIIETHVSRKMALQTAARSKLRAPFLAHPSPHIRRCWTLWPNVDHSGGSPKCSRCCAHSINGDLNAGTRASSA